MAPLGLTVRLIRDETECDDAIGVEDPSDDPAAGTNVMERVRMGVTRRREEPQEPDVRTPVWSRPRPTNAHDPATQRLALDPFHRRPVRRAHIPGGRFDPSTDGSDEHIRSFGRSNTEIINHVQDLHETLILPPPPRTFTEFLADIISIYTLLSTASDTATVNRCNTSLVILDKEMNNFEYAN